MAEHEVAWVIKLCVAVGASNIRYKIEVGSKTVAAVKEIVYSASASKFSFWLSALEIVNWGKAVLVIAFKSPN